MITKEKHFTKSETPGSSRANEEKKHTKLPNGNADSPNGTKLNQPNTETSKTETSNENKTVNEISKTNNEEGQTPKDNDDAASTYSGPKVGTVIPNRIFVGGFSIKTVDEDLWRFFSTLYNITAAKIIYDRSGMSKCYGFITFANPKDAKCIVKQTGGVMFSPMGRLRISQAVRKQIPHYQQPNSEFNPAATSAPIQVPSQSEVFYSPASCPPKPAVCLAYPVQTVQPVHHVPPMQHVSAGQPAPTIQGPPNVQSAQVQINNQIPPHTQPRSAPSTSPRSSTAGSSESSIHNNQSHNVHNYPENIYQGHAMMTGPHTYVIPSMGIPYAPPLPAYDATGLYTTCPGYAQPMAYPYAVVLQPPQREGAPTYGPSYGPAPVAYVPPPPTACYVRDATGKAPAHLPIMNSYIY